MTVVSDGGARKYKSYYGKTQQEAELKAAFDCGQSNENYAAGLTIKDIALEWLLLCSGKVRDGTLSIYQSKVYNHIIPDIGMMKAVCFTREQAREYISGKTGSGLSDTFVHGLGITLRSIFKEAGEKYGVENPFDIKIPAAAKREITLLTADEKKKVLKYGGTAEKIALTMGLRIGEVSGLRGEDVQDGVLRVCRTVERIQLSPNGTKLIIGVPKTSSSKRLIPIPDNIAELMKVNEGRYIVGGGEDPVEPRTIQYSWKRFCTAHGVRPVNFHTLRHTFATSALEAGVDIKTVSEILGHSSVQLTMDLYCHPSMEHKMKCMAKLWG